MNYYLILLLFYVQELTLVLWGIIVDVVNVNKNIK